MNGQLIGKGGRRNHYFGDQKNFRRYTDRFHTRKDLRGRREYCRQLVTLHRPLGINLRFFREADGVREVDGLRRQGSGNEETYVWVTDLDVDGRTLVIDWNSYFR